jgi:glycosyltransferase involved in cell wall biosynthesis
MDGRMTGGADGQLTVLHIFSGDLWAGAEVVIFNLLSCLNADAGLQVLALSLNEGVLTEKLRAAGITTHVIPEARHSVVGILCRAARLLKNTHIAVIHSHRYKENLLAWLLAKWLGASEVITTIHGLPESPTHSVREARLARWRTALDYFVVKRGFGCAVAVSEEMKRVLVRQYGFREDKVRVIRNGGVFPPPTTCPASSTGEYFHIGTVGRMVPVKGFELFLDVAAAVRRETQFVRFSILGDGLLREELVRRAASLNIGDCVEFVAPRRDPFPYYQTLDLYLNTSLHEGIPLSVVEAMACGKPVVSSAVGGIPEIVAHGEHGFLVESREPSRFAEWCLKLMRDHGLRRTMGERASAVARLRSSAPAMAEAYRRLYDECAARIRGRISLRASGAPGARLVTRER